MIHGFIVVDKPSGMTSHDVVARIRRIAGTRKAGHTGTLDPFATGVLPVAVNDGTKVIPFLDEASKSYLALVRLGVVTDTLDMTGTVLSQSDPSFITHEMFSATLPRFTGSITQTPPMFSAIKQNGQPLYKLARKGIEVERAERRVEIASLELLTYDPPFVSLLVTCSRGTYVRTLADDIGRELGCGAALQELRRTASGPFIVGAAVTLHELESADSILFERLVITPSEAIGHLPEIQLSDNGLGKVRHGVVPTGADISSPYPATVCEGEMVRLVHGGRLAAVAAVALQGGAAPRFVLKRVLL